MERYRTASLKVSGSRNFNRRKFRRIRYAVIFLGIIFIGYRKIYAKFQFGSVIKNFRNGFCRFSFFKRIIPNRRHLNVGRTDILPFDRKLNRSRTYASFIVFCSG